MSTPTYPLGIKRHEHTPFYEWCVRQGLRTDLIVRDQPAFWVRWSRHWYRIPEYGWIPYELNYLMHTFREGKDIKTRGLA